MSDPAHPADQADHGAAPPQTISANKARQAVVGHGVRYVLFLGLAGVVVSFIALAFYYAS